MVITNDDRGAESVHLGTLDAPTDLFGLRFNTDGDSYHEKDGVGFFLGVTFVLLACRFERMGQIWWKPRVLL